MDLAKRELFLFNDDISDEQLLKTYIACDIKYKTLEWYLYYENLFIDHTNSSYIINETSTQDELDYYFRYLKACHLGIEYIEHSLKLLLLLEGCDMKEIKRRKLEHNLEKHFEALTDENVKKKISESINVYGKEYIKRFVLKDKQISSIISSSNGNITNFDYFGFVLKILSDSFVDLRYPEVSKAYNYYDLGIILSICDNTTSILNQKLQANAIFKDANLIIHKHMDSLSRKKYTMESAEVDLDKPLTTFEINKMKSSNKVKHEALKWYMYGIEEFYLKNNVSYYSDFYGMLLQNFIIRERIDKKSNDKAVYDNYLYYQACHMTSDFIEHSLKLLLISQGYTYNQIKNEYGHNFEKMYCALSQSYQNELKEVIHYFSENYLKNTAKQNPDFKDKIKSDPKDIEDSIKYLNLLSKEEHTLEELKYINQYDQNRKNEFEQKVSYFDPILAQNADAFKFTRYPDFYNYNLNYKYCLNFLLELANGLQTIIERDFNVSYYSTTNFDLNEDMKMGKK